MAIEDNDNETEQTEKKTRVSSRQRAFNAFRQLLAEEIASLTGHANEGDAESKSMVEYLTNELLPMLDDIENPPEPEKKERKVRIPKGPGALTRRRFWIAVDRERNRTYHYVVDPRSIPNAVKAYGPLATEAGATYRVSVGVDGMDEFDLSAPTKPSSGNSIED